MVPLLTGWARLDQHSAHGTSLVGVVFTGVVGGLVYGKGAAVDWLAAGLLALGAVPATIFAARSSARIPASVLRRVFGLFLIGNAILLQTRGLVPATGMFDGTAATVSLVVLGAVVGVLSGLLGVGGGAVMVPGLALGPGFVQQLAQGTSLAAMVPSSAMGAVVHAGLGHVRRDVVFPLMGGIAAGSWIGGSSALALPDRTLQLVFSGVLILLGLRYLFRTGRVPAAGRG